jgi:hypothetical protein
MSSAESNPMNVAHDWTTAGWIGKNAGASIRCWTGPTVIYIARSMIARIVIVTGGTGNRQSRQEFILSEIDSE